jgi:hypothetical protein
MKHAAPIALIAIFVFVLAYMVANRYHGVQAGDTGRLWLLDSWTGTALFCNPSEARRDCVTMLRLARSQPGAQAQTQPQTTTPHQELLRIYPRWEEDVATPQFNEWLESQPESISVLMDSEELSDALRLMGMYYSSPSYAGR